jgi:uncharacterized membrane protein YeiB
VALKALAGGLLVLAFAALAQILMPKRFAGILSAAPSVALGSLLVTALFKTPQDIALSGRGMAVGAVAFTAYCLLAVPLVRHWAPGVAPPRRWPGGPSSRPPDTR